MHFSFLYYCIHCPSCSEPMWQLPQLLLCNASASAMYRVGVVRSFPKCFNWGRKISNLIYFTLYGKVSWRVDRRRITRVFQHRWDHTKKNVFVHTRHLDNARSDEFTGDNTPTKTFGAQSALIVWGERSHNIFRLLAYKLPVPISAIELFLLLTAV